MISEIGHFALALAVLVALLQCVLPLIGAAKSNKTLMDIAVPAALAQALLVTTSFLALTYAFVTSDFSVDAVARYSHTTKPLIYKISGVWGNHEGSMLLWTLILALSGGSVALFGRNLPLVLKARALAVQGFLGVTFLLFILFTSNPFQRLFPAWPNGNDLNPLLQDPGLAFHPPLLYGGYVGFSIAFSFAIAALMGGKVDAAWARWVRPWTLAAWSLLTLGIALGSYWAYYELGWGGWWFWDPVENASLMPWLLGTALLHSSIVVEKRNALKAWTILLAILTFSLSLLGTFLVRSGVLTSVHAFAVDPARGTFILVILVFVIGASLALFAWRAPSLKGGGLFAPVSREGALLVNNVLLTAACGMVLVGTLYPLVLEALDAGKISVGAPYFNMTFGVPMIPLLLLVPFGPVLAWKRGDALGALQRLYVAAGIAALVLLVTLALTREGPWLASLGIGLAVWLMIGALWEWTERVKLFRIPLARSWNRIKGLSTSAYGATLGHFGVGLMVLGIVGVTAWRSEIITVMELGETRDIAGFSVTFQSVEDLNGYNFDGERGIFAVSKGSLQHTLSSEHRVYRVTGQPTTEVGMRTTALGDLYVVLGDRQGEANQTAWVVRMYYNPLVSWIWLGALVMSFGACLSLFDRRFRIGAPQKARANVRSDTLSATP
jgi:cytochrome c-type biogenesis protein CcmF